MKDETREILDKLKDSVTNSTLAVYFTGDEEIIDNIKCLEPNECKILLDHITNLQEELKYQKEAEQEYNEKHTKLMNKYKELQQENARLKELDENYPIEEQLEEALKWKNIYKSRIDKANEYIKTMPNIDGYINHNAMMYRLLSILTGGDDKDVKD